MNILIDGNSIGWAMHSATKLSYRGMQTQAIYGFMRMLRDLRASNPSATVVVLWDGRAEHRFEIFPEYKGDRVAAREEDLVKAADHAAYKAQVPVIQRAIELLGIDQMLHTKGEADDLAGFLVSMSPGKRKRLTTGDGDWLQLVDETTDWYDPRKDGKLVTFANFHEVTGYATTDEFLQGKALVGDTSDSIPGIEDIGPTTAIKFLAKHRDVEKWFEGVDNDSIKPTTRKAKTAKTPHPEETLASPAGREVFRRNMALMNLKNVKLPSDGKLVITKGALDEERLRKLCDGLGFVSITRMWDTFLLPFRRAAVPAKAPQEVSHA